MKTTLATYPFEHFLKQMPKEVTEIITPESRTTANEFETIDQAILAGLVWDKTKNKAIISYYYDKLMEA